MPTATATKKPHQAISLLVHGYSKVGKSLLGVSGPTPRLLLDVESAARFLPIVPITWDPQDAPPEPDGTWDTAVVAVRSWGDAVSALTWLKTGQHPFKSTCVDSISELQYRLMEFLAPNQTQLKMQDWGAALRHMGAFVRGLRDMTMHPTNPLDAVVMTSMSKMTTNGWLKPYLQGQMQDVIPYIPDICAYLYVDTDSEGNETRHLLTRRRGQIEAGERVQGKVPPLLNLPVVSGSTLEEIRKKNVTVMALRKKIFQDQSLIKEQKVVAQTPTATVPVVGPSEEPEPETTVVPNPTPTPTGDPDAVEAVMAAAAAAANHN